MEKKEKRLDEAALQRVLRSKKRFMAELCIRLAWQAGLTRPQIHALTWNQISFEAAEIRLPSHTIPIHPDLLECLEDRRNRPRSQASEYVVLTDARHTHPHEVHIAKAVSAALDEEETLKDVSIKDLRADYVIRAVEQHGKNYALKVSNVAMATLHSLYGQYVLSSPDSGIEESPSRAADIDEVHLMEFFAAEGTSSAAIALWLVWKQKMTIEEIASLTWEQVDFKKNVICLPDRESKMHPIVTQLLKEIHGIREEGMDSHVLLSPKAKSAFQPDRLNVIVRTALVKRGLGALHLTVLSNFDKAKGHEEKVIAYLQDHRFVTRNEVKSLLATTQNIAYDVLVRLVNQGKLVRIGTRYYLEGTVVPPEQHRQVICDYLKGVKSAVVSDIANVLHIEKRACAWILHRMVEDGVITQRGQSYYFKQENE